MAAHRKVLASIIVLSAAVLAAAGYFFLFTHEGAEIILRNALKKVPSGLRVSYGRIEGNLARGVVCTDPVVSGVGVLPAGTVIKAEQVRAVVPLSFPVGLLLDAKNGKIELPNGSVIFFRGSYTTGSLQINLFTPATSFGTVSLFMPRARILKAVAGAIEHIDIFVSGTFREPSFTGNFLVPEAAMKHLAVRNLRCALNLTLHAGRKKPLLFGEVALSPATVFLRRTTINVDPGKVVFDGVPEKFVFQLRGVTKVADTDIALALNGTLEKPDFHITSVPPLPQDQLLMMLLTGKGRGDTGKTEGKGTLGTDVAKDFVDFLFLGGTGATLSERLGVESVHLTYDATTQGIEIKKNLGDSASVSYGIKEEKPEAATETEPVKTQTFGLEYKLTDKLSIEGTQEFKNLMNATQQEESPPESTIQLKYKKSF